MDPSDVSMDQLKVRYKRCREQLAIIRDLLLKTSTSMEVLETENNFLRERNEFLLQEKTGQIKSEDISKKTSKRSAAKERVALSLTTLRKIQEKLSEFEKVALSQRTALEEAKEECRKTKAKLEEAQQIFQREKKRNGHLQDLIISMEKQSKRDATSRDAVKRRLHLLAKEIHGLTLGLSDQQCSSQMSNNLKEMRRDSHNSSASVELVSLPVKPVKSSTPKLTTDGTGTGGAISMDDTTPKRKLAIRWDYWYYHRQSFQEPVPPQVEKEEYWDLKTVYSSLSSMATVYIIYASISSISSCLLKKIF